MMGYHSYISNEYPSNDTYAVWSVTDDQFEIGLDKFSCNWNTKYVADNHEKSMSTCKYTNDDWYLRNCYHAKDIVITCLVDKGI